MNTIQISETLTLRVFSTYVVLEREDGGLVRIEAGEVRHLVEALAQAAGELAQNAARGLP